VSQENVEIVRKAIDAFSRGDVDAFALLVTPDIEWTTGLGAIEGEVFHGTEGVETYFARLNSAWESFCFLAQDYRDHGELVVVLGELEGRSRGSAFPVISPVGAVWELCDAKIWRLRAYLDHAKALRVAGLAP
jgi:ketosteroid isomerase-like protein